MFHSRSLEHKINRVHERALRCVYLDTVSTFAELLKKDNSFSIHHRNIQAMAIEMYKAKNNLGPSILNNIFALNTEIRPNLRTNTEFIRPRVNTVYYGKDYLQYFGSVIWNIVPRDIKNSETLSRFKNKIRSWSPDECPCRLCEVYLHGVGYTNIVQ